MGYNKFTNNVLYMVRRTEQYFLRLSYISRRVRHPRRKSVPDVMDFEDFLRSKFVR